MKNRNYVIAGLFFLFALVQLNDPDPYFWVALYSYIGMVAIIRNFRPIRKVILLAGMAVCLIELFLILPEFLNWVELGMPTITGSMKAEEPHIEFTREFLGLLIGLGTLVFYYFEKLNHKDNE
ncbi:MAG: transmembrane 220 family protein [Saprospiraceae bacterium]|jgi:hypothetical protein